MLVQLLFGGKTILLYLRKTWDLVRKKMFYRVALLLADLSTVDLDFGCSTLGLVLPELKWLGIRARW